MNTGGQRGPLQPLEMATAAVLGALTVVAVLAGFFVPHASAVTALGVVPMAVVTYRHRVRATVAATVAATMVGFLVAGTGAVSGVGLCAVIGGVAGYAHRRGWGYLRVTMAGAVAGPVLAALYVALLLAVSSLRRLVLENIRNTARGFTRILARVPSLAPLARRLDRLVDRAVADWWQCVGVVVICFVVGAIVAAYRWTTHLLPALDRMEATDRLAPAAETGVAGPPAPVPVTVDAVTVCYPGGTGDALDGVSLHVARGTRTAVVGANGSGKSTLARVLAGCPPTCGAVLRPGPAGLGRPGGTAVVSQRPESQVLGVRAGDDVVWGLATAAGVDVDGLLGSVGLTGMAGRETSTLSGGELQRLALAAALARSPGLLIADEVTAMVDADGRRDLVGLLARLPAESGAAVVAVTHRPEEAEGADQVLRLDHGRRVVADPRPPDGSDPPPPAGRAAVDPLRAAGPADLLVLSGVGHVYAAGTPWAQVALRDVNLAFGAAEGAVIVGDNGSGKSTLAWIAAGLLAPTSGSCLLRGEPVRPRTGSVGLAFQHARLQVLAHTAGREVEAAGAVGREEAEAALAVTGLGDGDWWSRPVDQLSGGELGRVALAGLLARRPEMLILDEPLAGLDDAGRRDILAALARLRSTGTALVVITHDLEGLDAVCDRRIRLEAGRVAADDRVRVG